jgi:hypothetical protein
MVAVIDSLDNEICESITLEPKEHSEKADIYWNYPDKTVVVQVKSSRDQISLSEVKKWAEALQKEADADNFELVLIGPCADTVTKLGTHSAVKIPVPLSNNTKALLDQASHLLSSFLEKENVDPLPASVLRSISMQLVTDYFIKIPSKTTRVDLKNGIMTAISSTGNNLRQDSQVIIQAIVNENRRNLRQLIS